LLYRNVSIVCMVAIKVIIIKIIIIIINYSALFVVHSCQLMSTCPHTMFRFITEACIAMMIVS